MCALLSDFWPLFHLAKYYPSLVQRAPQQPIPPPSENFTATHPLRHPNTALQPIPSRHLGSRPFISERRPKATLSRHPERRPKATVEGPPRESLQPGATPSDSCGCQGWWESGGDGLRSRGSRGDPSTAFANAHSALDDVEGGVGAHSAQDDAGGAVALSSG